jgi:hypothetical protein
LSATRYLPAAQLVVTAFPGLLSGFGLNPHISRYILTETERGAAWLFVILEEDQDAEARSSYAATSLLNYLSEALHGLRVVFSCQNGYRYAILLSPSQNNRVTTSTYLPLRLDRPYGDQISHDGT